MTHDFLDPFTRAEIAYRQSRVALDWAPPNSRRLRVRGVHLARSGVVRELRYTGPQSQPKRVTGWLRWIGRPHRRPIEQDQGRIVPWAQARALSEAARSVGSSDQQPRH